MAKYRTAGTLDRKMCDYHPRDVLLCWCGYVRRDQVKYINKKDLIEINDDGTPVDPQDALFGEDR